MNNHLPNINLEQAQLALVLDLLKKFVPQHQVCVFGSRATGSPKTFSDLDLLVFDAQPRPTSRTWALMLQAFADSDLPYKVDVVAEWECDGKFLERVTGQAVTIQDGTG